MVLPAEPPAWPVRPPVVERHFDPPATPWGAGHRGIDLLAAPGTPVRALAAGRIAFAGEVAGTPVVSIDHGGWRSTYQPVLSSLAVGTPVSAGDAVGRTVDGSDDHCAGRCLHLGVIVADGYRDPLLVLRGPPVLKPARAAPHAGAPG